MKPFAIFCIALLCFAYLFAPINCQEEEENEAVFEEEEGDEFETHSSQKGVVEPELEDIIGNEAKDPFAGLDFDEEEFEEVEKVAQQPAASKPQKNDVKQAEQKSKAQATPAEATPAASSFSWANHDWSVEIAFLSFLAVFGANYFYGKSANYKMAHAWAKHFFPILKQQFAVVQPFLKESPYTYRLQGYGRDNCLGIQIELSLKRRQDLVSLLYSFFSPAPDTVQIDIPLEKLEDPFVFCVVKDKNKKKFLQQFEQELDGVKSYTAQSIPSSFVVLTDAKELVDRIVTPEVASVLRQNEELVREIHLTDCYQHYVHKNILSVVLNLPKEPVGMEQLLLMSLYLIDVAANVRLSKNALAKTKKRRMALEAEVRKEAKLKNEEAAQLRKLEKQKQEKERKEKLSPAEYQKYLDKEHQRQLRKKMAPRSKVVFG